MLQIEILTEDSKLIELCQKYWEMDHNHVFVFKVQDIAKEFGISSRILLDLVNQSSLAMDKHKWCDDCKKAFVYKNRQHYVKNATQATKCICIPCSSLRYEKEKKSLQDMLVKVQKQAPITIKKLSLEYI